MTTNQEEMQRILSKVCSRVKVFAGLYMDHLKGVLSSSKSVYCKEGEYLMYEGDESREFYVVLSGNFITVKKTPSGEETVAWTSGPGDSLGEVAFIDGLPRSSAVKAKSAGLLLAFDHKDVRKDPHFSSQIYYNIARDLSARIRQMA